VFRGLSNDRRQMAWNSTSDCSRSRSLGLVRNQRRLCQTRLDMMPSVVMASRDTVDICQELFADRRWNCSTILLAPKFLPDLSGSKLVHQPLSVQYGYPLGKLRYFARNADANSVTNVKEYCKTSSRSPGLLLEQVTSATGLYYGSGLCRPGAGFY